MTKATIDPVSRNTISQHLDYHNQFVSFLVNGQLLGVPVSSVQEVLNPQTIAPVPRAKTEIEGLLNLRGQIVTAVDLRKRLGLPPRQDGARPMNVVVHHQGESYSLLVDEVGEVINATRDALQPPPHTLEGRWKQLVEGVFRLEGTLFVILDVQKLLSF